MCFFLYFSDPRPFTKSLPLCFPTFCTFSFVKKKKCVTIFYTVSDTIDRHQNRQRFFLHLGEEMMSRYHVYPPWCHNHLGPLSIRAAPNNSIYYGMQDSNAPIFPPFSIYPRSSNLVISILDASVLVEDLPYAKPPAFLLNMMNRGPGSSPPRKHGPRLPP